MIIKKKMLKKDDEYREALDNIIAIAHEERFTLEERLQHIKEFAAIGLEKSKYRIK